MLSGMNGMTSLKPGQFRGLASDLLLLSCGGQSSNASKVSQHTFKPFKGNASGRSSAKHNPVAPYIQIRRPSYIDSSVNGDDYSQYEEINPLPNSSNSNTSYLKSLSRKKNKAPPKQPST